VVFMKGARAQAAAPDDGRRDGATSTLAPATDASPDGEGAPPPCARVAEAFEPALQPDGRAANASEPRRPRRARRAHATLEDEALSTCGALLGSIEALAFELPDAPGPRSERALADARRFGARVRDQLEAMSWLALPELRTTTQRAPFPVARWVEHACRGALPRVHALGGSLHWPSADVLGELSAELAVSRMDRALTVMIEQLAEAAGEGLNLTVQVLTNDQAFAIELSAQPASAEHVQGGEPLSPLLTRAWEALLAFHRGTFQLEVLQLDRPLTIRCTLPRLP
jgi:hypothetical protein